MRRLREVARRSDRAGATERLGCRVRLLILAAFALTWACDLNHIAGGLTLPDFS